MSSFASGRSGSGRGSISTVFAKSLETICKDELGVRVSDGGLCVFFPMNNATHTHTHTHHDTWLPGLLGHVVTAAEILELGRPGCPAAACACDNRLTALVFPLRAHVFLFFHLLSVFSTHTITNTNNSHTPTPSAHTCSMPCTKRSARAGTRPSTAAPRWSRARTTR